MMAEHKKRTEGTHVPHMCHTCTYMHKLIFYAYVCKVEVEIRCVQERVPKVCMHYVCIAFFAFKNICIPRVYLVYLVYLVYTHVVANSCVNFIYYSQVHHHLFVNYI